MSQHFDLQQQESEEHGQSEQQSPSQQTQRQLYSQWVPHPPNTTRFPPPYMVPAYSSYYGFSPTGQYMGQYSPQYQQPSGAQGQHAPGVQYQQPSGAHGQHAPGIQYQQPAGAHGQHAPGVQTGMAALGSMSPAAAGMPMGPQLSHPSGLGAEPSELAPYMMPPPHSIHSYQPQHEQPSQQHHHHAPQPPQPRHPAIELSHPPSIQPSPFPPPISPGYGEQQHIAPAGPSSQPPIAPATLTTTGLPPVAGPSSASPTSTASGGSAAGYYNPFAHILNKANLHVEGDLDTMVRDWTQEEWENQRRLVRFWRRQEGNEVICSFAPISQRERPQQQNMIVVSCIYWRERNDYYITSVDCIYLLENLIGVRFTVEEKNRIRRNLEGFRPLTVSKVRSDSAEFFKLIMSFPNPKPRNIEKDVKVFPWQTLGTALKKIISKYTASYSSTASVNLEALNPAGSSIPPPQPPIATTTTTTTTTTTASTHTTTSTPGP